MNMTLLYQEHGVPTKYTLKRYPKYCQSSDPAFIDIRNNLMQLMIKAIENVTIINSKGLRKIYKTAI